MFSSSVCVLSMAEQSISLAVNPATAEVDGGDSRGGECLEIRKKILQVMICKYGRQHAFEKKARCPFPRRIIKKPPDDQSLAVSDRGKEDISG
ncbi:hypothetical protein Peur_052644 [Populus x canadensis]